MAAGLQSVMKLLTKEFATPVKTTGRGSAKKFVPTGKTIMRMEESVEKSLSPRMERALDVEKFPEAADQWSVINSSSNSANLPAR